jgi:ankyrin repeat protein
MTASWYNHEEMVRLLLAAGADPNRRDQSSLTALHLAARTDNAALVRMLLDAGANPNVISESLYETPMHEAAARSVPAVVALLAAAHAVLEVRDHEGLTPLHVAACDGRSDNVRALLAASADPDASGPTARRRSSRRWHRRIDQPGRDDGHRGCLPRSPMTRTAPLPRRCSAARSRPRCGSSNAAPTSTRSMPRAVRRSPMRRTAGNDDVPLPAAARRGYRPRRRVNRCWRRPGQGNRGIVRDLLERGLRYRSRDAYGRTPLLTAVVNHQPGTVELLLASGADRHARDDGGEGAEELLALADEPIRAEISLSEQSAAWRPTEHLHAALDGLRESREAIRRLLGLP